MCVYMYLYVSPPPPSQSEAGFFSFRLFARIRNSYSASVSASPFNPNPNPNLKKRGEGKKEKRKKQVLNILASCLHVSRFLPTFMTHLFHHPISTLQYYIYLPLLSTPLHSSPAVSHKSAEKKLYFNSFHFLFYFI